MKRPPLIIGATLWFLALILALLPSWPHIYYRLSPQTSEQLAHTLGTNPTKKRILPAMSQPVEPQNTPFTPSKHPLPPLNLSLPKKNGLIIESIGVRGEIHQGENWQEILKQGLWQVPNFGTPENNTQPIIIAAHRWGYLNWSNQFRYLNSFYNLPKLKINDKIKINWNQRQYIYKVESEEINEKISNYSADLILYTCKLWNSPLRIIKYAKRLN